MKILEIMLKIPACGLPNPAVSFKKSYRKHGEFAPLLNTTDKRDRGLQSIDKIQNKLRWKGFQPNHWNLKTKLSKCQQLKSIFLPAGDSSISYKLGDFFQPTYVETTIVEEEEWDMHETNSLDAWSEDSPLLEEQQHCEELNHKEQSKGTMTSLRRKMSAKCRKLEYTIASIPSFFHRLVNHRGQNSLTPTSSDSSDEYVGHRL